MEYKRGDYINVNEMICYANLDTAIEDLIKLRDELKAKGFNHSTIDYEMSPIPYDDNNNQEVEITVNVG